MKPSRIKSWMRLVLYYWLLVSVIIFLEIRYMKSDWAGLPGFLLTLPLSVLVVIGYFLANYAAEFRGFNTRITEYYTEYGFVVCALLNGLLFYPLYRWWLNRKQPRFSEPPPPPPDFA
jgi:hypothetical protein